MRVCIVRNAEAKSNAGIFRIVDALISMGAEPITLTRSRFNSKSGKFGYKPFKFKERKIPNYEFQYQTDVGRGLSSIFQLLIYQFMTTGWLFKNRKKFDVIHAFDLDSGIPAVITSLLTKKKLVYHIADFYVDSRQGIPEKLKTIVKQLEFFIISKSNATIICTEERKEQIKGSKPNKLYIIHNSPIISSENELIDNDSTYTMATDNKKVLTLGYVGGLTEPRFIKEIIDIAKNNPKINLKIAGFGYLEEHVKEATNNYKNITFYGRVSYEDALKLYAKCDIMFAMYDPKIPNHRYSAPNKVYEAMMLGLPIIVAKGTGINDLVETEQIGFSIDYSKESFNNLVTKLVEQRDLLNKYKRNAKKAYKKYSWESMKQRLKELYTNL